MGISLNAQGQLTAVTCQIGPKFKLVRDVMVVLHTCKTEEDPIKNEGARVLTRSYRFLMHSRAANSAFHEEILPNFKLIQVFMVDLVTCKNEEDLIKK